MRAEVDDIKAALQKPERIKRYVGESLPAQVEKAWVEMGGKPFLSKQAHRQDEERHAHAHGQPFKTSQATKTR
jgi:hypothetical protein